MELEAVRPGHRRALAALIAAGALLRLWQYAGGTSLTVDEIGVAQNVLHRPLGRLLFTPLDFDQVAPPGFLLAVKAATALLGPTDRALRVIALICSLASLGLFLRLARHVLSGWTLLFATGLFCFGAPLIRYSSEVKQYSGDVAASILLTVIALELRRRRSSFEHYGLAGVIGAVVVCFSQAAVFVLAGLGLALVLIAFAERDRAAWRTLPWTLIPWTAGATMATLLGRHSLSPETSAYLQSFWRNGFWPLPPRSPRDVLWLAKNLRGFWGQSLFDYPFSVVYLVLMVVGFWALWRRRREVALMLLGPVAAMLAAAAAQRYPFQSRLLLPLAPAFLLAASEGAGSIAARLPLPLGATASLLALPPLLALIQNRPVHSVEETRPMLSYVAEHRRANDPIYVYHGAVPAFRYYGPRFGLDAADALLGGCHRDDPRAYLREIDRFRGQSRLWVLFAHDVPRLAEQATIRDYLRRIGVPREGIVLPDGGPSAVTAELYDLENPERLTAASAESFPLPESDEELVRRLGCGSAPLARKPASRP